MSQEEYAAPYLQDTSEDFGLSTPRENREKLDYLLPKARILREAPNYTLYTTGTYASGSMFAVSKNLIRYYVEFKEFKSKTLGTFVTQTAVWNAPGGLLPQGFTLHIALEVLLPRTKCLVSDAVPTHDGKRLWVRLMTHALDKGYAVGVYDERKLEVIDFDEEDLELWATNTGAWGRLTSNMSMRFFIKIV